MILAQSTPPTTEPSADAVRRLFEYVSNFQLPTRTEFITQLETLHPLQSVGLMVAGIAFLVYGYKYFKLLVMADAAVIGGMLGVLLSSMRFSHSPNAPIFMGLAGAVLMGVVAWPALKYCVCGLGALAGGLAGYGLWYFIANSIGNEPMRQYTWTGGLIGAIVVSLLTFVIFRVAVMIFTSLQGAVMGVAGACGLLLAHPDIRVSLAEELRTNDYLLNLLIGVPMLAAFVLQWATEAAKIKKKRKETEKPPV